MRTQPLLNDSVHKNYFLPIYAQIDAWQAAVRKISWSIGKEEFKNIVDHLPLTKDDMDAEYTSLCLFYGFGDDGNKHADEVLSGKLAWDYAKRSRKRKTWQSPYINFDNTDAFRLRPGAPPRPGGFYFLKMQSCDKFLTMPAFRARKLFNSRTGLGPEGLQFLCITHPHYIELMSERKVPFMALADYDVAPYGYDDFFDVPQIFSSNRILGLGIGHVDHYYNGFGIPTVHF